MEIERSATDCCNQKVTQKHYLTVESLPPSFTTTSGSLDIDNMLCDSNIHPKVTGSPEFEPGCKDAIIDIDAEDTFSFDQSTCETTVTRTFTATQDDCAALR